MEYTQLITVAVGDPFWTQVYCILHEFSAHIREKDRVQNPGGLHNQTGTKESIWDSMNGDNELRFFVQDMCNKHE